MTNDMDGDRLIWQREESVAVPSETENMLVRKKDWDRIKRRLRESSQPIGWVSKIYSALISAGLAALLSIYPLHQSVTSTDPWVIPLYLIFGIFALFVGIILVLVDRHVNSNITSDADSIVQDMEDVEKEFPELSGHGY